MMQSLSREEKERIALLIAEKKRRLKIDPFYGPPTAWYNPQPKHIQASELLLGPVRHVLLVGGSRSGKTFEICKAIVHRAIEAPGSRHAILRQRANAARSSIWLDTLPRVFKECFPRLRYEDHRMDGYIELLNGVGSEIWIGGLDEKERVEKILGTEYATIYLNEGSQIALHARRLAMTRLAQRVKTRKGDWLVQKEFADLNPVGKPHWSYRLWIQHIDPESRQPVSPEEYAHLFISPEDNAPNLSTEYLSEQRALPERYRRRFYEGIYVDEIEGALWTMESLDACRCEQADVPTTLDRVVVAIDPSGTDGKEQLDNDTGPSDVGIVVAGRAGKVGYLLADLTTQEGPEKWAKIAITAYRDYHADRIVAERNFGGDMVRAVIDAAADKMKMALPPVELVTASRGKAQRAEPVSVLYEPDVEGMVRIHHVGQFVELEEEQLNFSTSGYMGPKSPNRADACVWAFTDLMLGAQPKPWGRHQLEVVE